VVDIKDMIGLQTDLDSLRKPDQGRSCSITRNRLLGLLPQEIAADLIASSKIVILEKGQLLMRSGEAIEHVYFPHGGIASLIAELPDGRGVEVASIGIEGALGVARALFPALAFCTVVVRVPGLATRISARKLTTIVDENKSVRNFFGLYSMLLVAELKDKVLCTSFHDVRGRLSRILLQARDHLMCNTLPMTQEMLSEMRGVRRTTVTAVAGSLQSDEIISFHRGTIEIRNEAALRKSACSCYSATRTRLTEFLDESAHAFSGSFES
jgi:CRP-like cAMP-binding protein